MTDALTLTPIQRVNGSVTLPGSKSMTNRALLLAAVAQGETLVTNILFSDDTQRMLDALTQLGVRVDIDRDQRQCQVLGKAGPFPADSETRALHLGNAGTVLRPLTAMRALTPGDFVIDGDHYMRERPIGPLTDALQALNVSSVYLGVPGYPPLQLRGGNLKGGALTLDGRLSSQYLTALLLSLPMGTLPSTIDIDGELVSKPYIDMTLAMMSAFGVQASHTDYQRFYLSGNQRYQSPGHFMVEGDASTASYFLAAAAICGDVTVHGVGRTSLQGDVAFAEVVRAMGAKVDCQDASIRVQSSGELRGIDADLNHIPDAAMTVAILALFAEGPTTIRNIYNWRIKETDRMTAMATELQRVGATVTTTRDSITITPPKTLLPASIETYGDHRMAMCFSLVALGGTQVTINDPSVTSKTFPDYFKVFESICER